MNFTFPLSFSDYDSYVEYTEDARRTHLANQTKINPRQWLEIFPEIKNRVEELLIESLEIRDWYFESIAKTEETFSTDLNTRLFEEA